MSGAELARERTKTALQTAAIGIALAALVLTVGFAVLGRTGLVVIAVAVGLSLVQSTRVSLQMRPADAAELRYADAPWLFDLIDDLCRRAGIAVPPRIYYSRSPLMNAMTFGVADDTSILLTAGVVNSLSRRELAGVVAHEVAHIRNNDLQLFRIAELARVTTHLVAQIGWFSLLLFFPLWAFSGAVVPGRLLLLLFAAPLVSILLQLALFRTREFAADATAAGLTNDPLGLASALRKIDAGGRSLFEQLFPVSRADQRSLFRTHPPTPARIRRLTALAGADNRQAAARRWWGSSQPGLYRFF